MLGNAACCSKELQMNAEPHCPLLTPQTLKHTNSLFTTQYMELNSIPLTLEELQYVYGTCKITVPLIKIIKIPSYRPVSFHFKCPNNVFFGKVFCCMTGFTHHPVTLTFQPTSNINLSSNTVIFSDSD